MNRLRRALAFPVLLALAACAPPAGVPLPAASPTASRPASATPAPAATVVPSLTPPPSATPVASRTPKPSPTLPAGDVFACLPPDGERVSGVVAGVIDGDTIRVQIGAQSFTVRYLGIDTPEITSQPPERLGPEATARNRDFVTGKRVTLVSDPEAGSTDIYDRLLRWVIVDGIFVNVELVREGLARYYAGANACGAVIFAAENEARAAHVGLWAP